MKTLKRVASVVLAFVLVIGMSACNKKGGTGNKKPSSDNSSGYSSTNSDDYNSTVSDWKSTKGDNTQDGKFDQGDKVSEAPTPGSNTQTTVVNVKRPTGDIKKPDKNARGSVTASGMKYSPLMKEENLQYLYKGKNYAYGISNDGNEYIAFMDEFGDMLDVTGGCGNIILQTAESATVLSVGKLKSFEKTMLDSWEAVNVKYELNTFNVNNADITVSYVFKENCISVSAKVIVNSSVEIASGTVNRNYINNMKSYSTRVNKDWYYPKNGDEPYLVFESISFRNQITDSIYAYTFLRSQGLEQAVQAEKLTGAVLPMDFEASKGLNYTVEYDMSFVDTSTDNLQGADYLGLFRGFDSEFAVGVAPIEATNDNSTVFLGNSVRLNVNFTNLLNEDLKFSLRYDVMDYYGNVVDAGIFIDNTVYKYTDANRVINVSGKYGIYYLNLYAISEHSSYRECYPFALLEKYDYKYLSTSPWGINSVNCNKNNKEEWIGSARLLAKIGSATYRLGADDTQLFLADEMIKNGITRFYGGANLPMATDATMKSWTENVLKIVAKLEKYVTHIEIGNEFNLQCLTPGGPSEEEIYPLWYKYVFEPSFKAISEKYPNLIYLPTPDSACSPNWLNQFVNGYWDKEVGEQVGQVWNKVKAVDTHIYGPPFMPDAYAAYKPAYGSVLWNIENGMQRMKSNLERLNDGDVTKTDFFISEVGYQARPSNPSMVDYRTQADYIVRIGAMCPAYSADVIGYYCMYDRISYSTGCSTNGEFHFGLFNEHDYYGIIKPKPSGIAFAVMTRQLESYKKDSAYINEQYDEGWDVGGVRAFTLDTAINGKVTVAWSNSEVLPNGKKDSTGRAGDRNPTLPWENQWKKTDKTTFNAAGSTVKVVDTMGNSVTYKADADGKVTIPLTGSPVYIYGIK